MDGDEHNHFGRFSIRHRVVDSQVWLLDEFETLLRKAKNKGIEQPLEIVDLYIDRKNLSDVRVFGLKFGIIFTFVSPVALYGLKVYCASVGLTIDLHEDDILTFTFLNGGAVMAFGFGHGVHEIAARLAKHWKRNNEENNGRHNTSDS